MANLEEVKVGDKIAINSGWGMITSARTVAKVFVKYIEDNLGDKWNKDGSNRGNASYRALRAEPWTAATDQLIADRRRDDEVRARADSLRSVPWRNVPADVVDAVRELVKAYLPAESRS